MTFALTIINPMVAIWQVADQTITRGSRIANYDWCKQVVIRALDGAMLLAYSGPAEVPGRRSTAEWLTETVAIGTPLSVDETLERLTAQATATFGRAGFRTVPLRIGGGITSTTGCFGVEITNQLSDGHVSSSFARRVVAVADRVDAIPHGSGAPLLSRNNRLDQLLRIFGRCPRRTDDFLNLLALVNHEIATQEPSISPWCQTACMPVEGWPLVCKTFLPAGSAGLNERRVVRPIRIVDAGIDLTHIHDALLQRLTVNQRHYRSGRWVATERLIIRRSTAGQDRWSHRVTPLPTRF